MLIILTD